MKRLKYAFAAQIKQRPALMARAWNMMPRLGFLLPHDRDYYGFRLLPQASDGLFVDVGANNGISAAGFRRVIGSGPSILSIEANPAHRASLQRLKRSDPGFDYRIIGLGREPGRFTLYTPYAGSIALTALSSGRLDYLRESTQRDYGERVTSRLRFEPTEVEVVTLDSLDLEPSIIKLDVEGLDFEVLLGGEGTIDRYRPAMLLEYTPRFSGSMIDGCAARNTR
jgi:FkbM family methyltransferase